MQAYTKWVNSLAGKTDPNSVDIHEEVKYDIPSGNVFEGGWCRPQNDGPGLRAIALIDYATALLAKDKSKIQSLNLWQTSSKDGAAGNGGAIPWDLDWIIGQMESSTCDLWEEIRATDLFWNKFTMRRALIKGAAFATLMGDSDRATAYTN